MSARIRARPLHTRKRFDAYLNDFWRRDQYPTLLLDMLDDDIREFMEWDQCPPRDLSRADVLREVRRIANISNLFRLEKSYEKDSVCDQIVSAFVLAGANAVYCRIAVLLDVCADDVRDACDVLRMKDFSPDQTFVTRAGKFTRAIKRAHTNHGKGKTS
jgi:hypothetical protein